jgi:hypothetical protein
MVASARLRSGGRSLTEVIVQDGPDTRADIAGGVEVGEEIGSTDAWQRRNRRAEKQRAARTRADDPAPARRPAAWPRSPRDRERLNVE